MLGLNYDCLDLLWNGIIWILKEGIPFDSMAQVFVKKNSLNFEGIDYFKLVYMSMKINFYFRIILQIYNPY